jgi:hypothetical protein
MPRLPRRRSGDVRAVSTATRALRLLGPFTAVVKIGNVAMSEPDDGHRRGRRFGSTAPNPYQWAGTESCAIHSGLGPSLLPANPSLGICCQPPGREAAYLGNLLERPGTGLAGPLAASEVIGRVQSRQDRPGGSNRLLGGSTAYVKMSKLGLVRRGRRQDLRGAHLFGPLCMRALMFGCSQSDGIVLQPLSSQVW